MLYILMNGIVVQFFEHDCWSLVFLERTVQLMFIFFLLMTVLYFFLLYELVVSFSNCFFG